MLVGNQHSRAVIHCIPTASRVLAATTVHFATNHITWFYVQSFTHVTLKVKNMYRHSTNCHLTITNQSLISLMEK